MQHDKNLRSMNMQYVDKDGETILENPAKSQWSKA